MRTTAELITLLRGQAVLSPGFAAVADALESLSSGGGPDTPAGTPVEYDTDGEFPVDEGYLVEKIIPFYGDAGTITIGTTDGGNDILTTEDVAAGWNDPIVINTFFASAGSLFIAGMPAGSTLVYFTQKIKTA